jgi:enhancing lycopene biosynthesis protein 2
MKKFAVLLSGCGVYDGSEIHEATLSLLAIARQGCNYEIFAPDINQHHVINHMTGEEMKETRNVLVESARIARGKIKSLNQFNPSSFDALIIPGGYGAAKNLSNWAFEGTSVTVLPQVEEAVRGMIELKKPIGALCISPVIMAKLLGKVRLTVGDDKETIEAIESFGVSHVTATHGEVVVDQEYKVVSSPCYMLDASIDQVAEGIENAVAAILKLTE